MSTAAGDRASPTGLLAARMGFRDREGRANQLNQSTPG
jgi:hypothetical protein